MEPHRPLHVLGLSGSLRARSFNTALLHTAAELAPSGMRVAPFRGLGRIPHFDQDLESEGDPEPVAAWKSALREADVLLIATPEYNAGPPGALKNALDWASRPPRRGPLRGMPVALMGASPSPGGTTRAQAQLRDVLTSLGARLLPEPIVGVARAHEHFDDDLRLTDETHRATVLRLLVHLQEWAGTDDAARAGTMVG